MRLCIIVAFYIIIVAHDSLFAMEHKAAIKMEPQDSLYEQFDEVSFEKHSDFSSTYGINQVNFVRNRFVWESFVNEANMYVNSGTIEEKKHIQVTCNPYSRLAFASSLDFYCYLLENSKRNYVRIYDLNSFNGFGCRDFAQADLPNNNSSYTAFTLDPYSDRCAVGNEMGEIFIISLKKSFELQNSDCLSKMKQVHQAPINCLHFDSNSRLFSCDNEGNIVIWGDRDQRLLPFKKEVSRIISSGDGTIIAFQHHSASEQNYASILDLNSFELHENKFGRIIAITESHKILAHENEHLCTFNLDGTVLKKVSLPKTAKIYGNEMPVSSLPLFLMTTEEKITKEVDVFIPQENFPCTKEPMFVKCGSKPVEEIQTTFWLPK